MGVAFSFPWEIQFMEWLQSLESGFTNALATFFTMLGEEMLLVLIVGTIYWCINKDLGRKISLSMMGGMICGSMLKSAVTRRRPYFDNPSIKCFRASDPKADLYDISAQGFSFPSLHSLMSASTYSTMAVYLKKRWMTILAVLIPLFIGLSRNYLGVHYPTDVLAGWLLGCGYMLLNAFLEKKFGYKGAFLVAIGIGTCGLFYCRDNEFFTGYGILVGMFAGLLYEEKYVNFTPAKHWWSFILRPVIGIALFLGINALLKLPINAIGADPASMGMFLLRALRYAITIFVIIGVYPRFFKKETTAENETVTANV